MDPALNPFAPGHGAPPPALVGREEILREAEMTLGQVRDGRTSKNLLLVGLRGVGKTVLLNRVQQLAQEQFGFLAILIEAQEDKRLPALLLPPLRSIQFTLNRFENVSDDLKPGLRVLKSFASGISLLLAVADAAASRKRALALSIDEMQYLTENEMSALIMAVHRVVQSHLPLVLIGAGLPQLVGLAGKSKSDAERLFNFPEVGALGRGDAKAALSEPVRRAGVSFEDRALEEIVDVTQGYPYFLQEWGYHSWNTASNSKITLDDVQKVHEKVIQKLDESFFRVRLARLTRREKDYLRAMAELGPLSNRSRDIADVLGMKVRSAAPLRSALIKKGMIFSPTYGNTAFTVPLFDEFMKRTIPKIRQNRL